MMLQKHLESAQREGKYRICIIDDADEMNSSTANSFLKTLEEPPINTILILLTTKLQSIMPTVLSRCQLVFFKPLSYKVIEEILVQKFLIDKNQARAYARIANGNIEHAIRLTQDKKQEARNLSVKLVKAALEKDDLNIINNLTVNKDKFKAEFISDVLNFLSIWLNDLAFLKTGCADIVNEDYKELLLSCADKIQRWETGIPDSIVFIDNMHQKIDGKVNIQYILVNLYDNLKTIFPSNSQI
jgi:DNA polymerase-3 subunit delta'